MKIGIIGGGISGLLTAWLVEKEHEVFVFDKNSFLGGHAETINVNYQGKSVPIDVGFDLFNEAMFPYLNRLLKILNVPKRSFELTVSFNNLKNETLVLPPFRDGKLIWEDFKPKNLLRLIYLRYVMGKIDKFMSENDKDMTFGKFVDNLKVSKNFKDDFFCPFVTAGWGTSIEDFKKFSAFNVLSWYQDSVACFHAPFWYEIPDGVSEYIKALANQLNQTNLKLKSTISSIKYSNQKYSIFEEEGGRLDVDALVIATNANEAHDLIKDIPHAQAAIESLKKVDYFPAKIVIHSDKRFLPQNPKHWSVANVIHNKNFSTLHTYKPWKGEIIRSWISPEDEKLPDSVHYIKDYRHAFVNNNYFVAQKELNKLQGVNNLFFGGMYTSGIDSHESAILSAIKISNQLSHNSENLFKLTQADNGYHESVASACPFMRKSLNANPMKSIDNRINLNNRGTYGT